MRIHGWQVHALFISLALLIPTDQVRMRTFRMSRLTWRGRRETRGPMEESKGEGGKEGRGRRATSSLPAYRACRKWMLRARSAPGFRRLAEAPAPGPPSSFEGFKPSHPGSTEHGSCSSPPVGPVGRGSSTARLVVISTTGGVTLFGPFPSELAEPYAAPSRWIGAELPNRGDPACSDIVSIFASTTPRRWFHERCQWSR